MKKWAMFVIVFGLFVVVLASCQFNAMMPFTAATAAPTYTLFVFETNLPTETPEMGIVDQVTATPSAPEETVVIAAVTQISEPTTEVYLPITTSQTVDLYVPGQLPALLHQASSFAPNVRLVAEPPQNEQDLTLKLDIGSEQIVSHWVYALVTPFAGAAKPGINGVAFSDILQHWQGQGSGPFAGQPLLLTQETLDILVGLWGGPRPESVRVVSEESLLDEAWAGQNLLANQPVLALIPFEKVEPRWRVLPVDGQSPLHNDFNREKYPLVVPLSLSGNPAVLAQVLAANTPTAYDPFVVRSNRESNRLTVVAMTGVTALVRSTAFTMEIQGNTYPGLDVGPILRAADIAHVSNEVPFAVGCPEPDPNYASLRFCSQDNYIELLEDVGTDVIELTGDHFHDWGPEAMLHTLDLYNTRGWGYYGGGENLADGQKPLLIEHNGNRIAFIGCNGKGPFFARATETEPGSVPCDMPLMAAEVARLKSEGYLPIFTFQHHETYSYEFVPTEKDDFRMVADAGAVVVSGSQAHQPHDMEFYAGAFIHYGLGNLFFDQYLVSEACRQGFIDRHVFYDGRYVGLELIPIYFVDFARPRLMTETETSSLLNLLFEISGFLP